MTDVKDGYDTTLQKVSHLCGRRVFYSYIYIIPYIPYTTHMVEHVFLYGTLHSEKLCSILGEVTVPCGCILKNHKIVFSVSQSVFQGSSVATNLPHDGTDVLRFLYEMSERQADLPDLFMGSRVGSMMKKRVGRGRTEYPCRDNKRVT